jgi:hypothetical protein
MIGANTGDSMMITTTSAMTCHQCHLDGGPFPVDEALLHVATHNRLHHGGAPIAVAVTSACAPDIAADIAAAA